MEIWDGYDRDGMPAGVDLVRGEKIPGGLYHLGSEILVRHRDGDFLMMRRDLCKPVAAGMYELSAGGSVLKGETALEGAKRELREETGLDDGDFRLLFSVVSEEHRSIFNIYLCLTGCDKDSVVLQEGETISYQWVTPRTLVKMLGEKDCKICRPESIRQALRILKLM